MHVRNVLRVGYFTFLHSIPSKVWPTRCHNLVSRVSSPLVGYLFQSYGEFVFSSCITNLYNVIICCHGHHESCFCSREVNPESAILQCLLTYYSSLPIFVSVLYYHIICLVLCSCWFEKVSIDFLPVGLSLIDYDILL